ncbi:MAG: hypothetical protein M3P49_13985 [Actinomycetota bacterium]|nr:hypothetical protein [Actinomycetota bacterium]
MGNDQNDGGYRGPGEYREEVNFADELAQDGWCPVRPPWHGREDDPPAEIALDKDPLARLLVENVAIWRGDRSRSFTPSSYDVTPWVAPAAEILELLGKGKSEDLRRAGGCPATVKEMEARLRLVIPALMAAPRRFWDPTRSARTWERHVYDRKSPKTYGEAILRAELWQNSFTREELYAFVALNPSDRREPRRAMDRAVYLHVAFPDGFELVIEDEDNSYDRF